MASLNDNRAGLAGQDRIARFFACFRDPAEEAEYRDAVRPEIDRLHLVAAIIFTVIVLLFAGRLFFSLVGEKKR